MASPKVTFESGGAFVSDTRREVEAYLASRRTRVWGSVRLYAKAPVALGLIAVSWSVLVLAHPGPVVGVACLGALVMGALLTAFCVQHDANHGAYFRRRGLNHPVGWSADALLGFSSYAWRVKHNIAHHTYTNVDGHDDDITQMPFARFTPRSRDEAGTATSTSTSGRSTRSWGSAGRRSATSPRSRAARSATASSASRAG